ncbi:hypothetical protein [Janthinobacterium agaricidamnosum]|uniref:Transmembrane protein n=1 Tax=Janthinobacterium agaricidamnosum NBRC 102515 = DSM 9628 TaxID=1349767 RepID=W0UYQ4_9BURK|nr:hypothetical protein [Janthinobacterium agaricidamnosum]CDG81699.1 hypothetical protein GJA_1044 [Janthinobacterium agaricidamnosum NBRC 102515 = DSM 9628]
MRPILASRAAGLGIVWYAAAAAGSALAAPVSQVFLVQNSGWMEPFYTDPSSQYKALVTEVVMAATQADDLMVLASFNQGLPGAPSPKALLAEKVVPQTQRAQLARVLDSLTTSKKPGSNALADTDLGEAVSAAIGSALNHKPGLVWLFTNNKNSPNNDQATALRNREFYTLIHHGADIKKALAFPLKMPVKGERYSANGLMVYVFAIQDQGARQLDDLLRSGRLQKIITETPARLKPLDQDTVRLSPTRVEGAPGVELSMAPNGMLRADVQSDASAPSARIHWKLENAIYPYTISNAHLAARSLLAGQDQPIALGSDQVSALAPGKGLPLSSVMQLPVGKLPGKWSTAAIASAGSAVILPGSIQVQLSEQSLELSQAFTQRMGDLFPGDPLPDIFTPPSQVQGSRAVLPIQVRVHYGMAPLLTLIAALLALLAAGAVLLMALTRSRRVQVTVEGELRTLHVKAGGRQPLYDKAGNKVAELKTTLFGNTLTDLREGAQVRLGR